SEPYRLGAGDIVRLSVYEHPDLNTVARIAESGSITFPLVGGVSIVGLTEREAEMKLADLLQRKEIVRSPQVTLIVDSYQSQRVSILGEVAQPGLYPISRGSTVVDLIAEAGGLNENAGDVAIVTQISDGQAHKIRVNLGSILRGELTAQNLQVGDGDRIYVPMMEQFYVYGQVNRPGVYRLERGMTVMQALSVAGGLTDKATERGMEIKRNSENHTTTIAVGLTHTVLPGDVVYVKESLF
ncbi:MAG: SLBB domain-containing protein, partial [Chromatiales bacterium]|nr:SLBB domain-containing protein [Chromatiales bacterium]